MACVATALEGEQGVQFVVMLAPEFFGFGFALFGFEQESLLDDLDGVRAGEFQIDGEAAFDLGEVQSLADRAVADHGVDVFLRGDNHPHAPVGAGEQFLGDGLQVQHTIDISADELADFVHQEHKSEIFRLPLQPVAHIVGEVGDGGVVLLLVILEDVAGLIASCRRERLVYFGAGECGLCTAFGPGLVGQPFELGLELFETTVVVEVAFQFGDVLVGAVISARIVEDANEGVHQRGFAAFLRDAVDVEQQRHGRNAQVGVQQPFKFVVFSLARLGFHVVDDFGAGDRLPVVVIGAVLGGGVTEDVGEDFQQVRFTGSEEAGDPYAVGVIRCRIVVGVEELFEIGLDLVGQHVFADLVGDFAVIAGLDHTIDLLIDVLDEDLLQLQLVVHELAPSVIMVLRLKAR